MLKALSGPFPDVKFCPTGGVGPTNAGDYLSLDNVICVGGSWMAWMVPSDLVKAGDWQGITDLSKEAISLVSQF